jgi:hypothetical protein
MLKMITNLSRQPWSLELGASLGFGAWNLELLRPSVLSVFSVATPTPDSLSSWLVSATAVLSIAALVKQFVRKPPLEAEFLTRADFQTFHDKLERALTALETKLDTITDRLHDVRALVDRLDERTQHSHAWEPIIKHRRSKSTNPEPKIPTV